MNVNQKENVSLSDPRSSARSGPDPLLKPRIDVRDLHYQIDGGRTILDGLSFAVKPGEILCVMGLSGSGKSTLLRCVAGLAKPASGQILIDDDEVTNMTEDELARVRARMGVVFQYAALFDSMSVFDNVAFGILRGPKRREMRKIERRELIRLVAERLRQVGLPGVERRVPSELSGGMRRRVGLARALATDPDIVLYDEPTSGLDPVTAASIDDLIMQTRANRGVTSIVVSHDMGSIFRIADTVMMLYEGKAVVYGTPDEVRASANPVVQQFIAGRTQGPIQIRR